MPILLKELKPIYSSSVKCICYYSQLIITSKRNLVENFIKFFCWWRLKSLNQRIKIN